MALVVLVSTTGFTMSMHFCGGELQDLAFFAEAKACEAHTEALPPCHQQEDTSHDEGKKDPCCQDQLIVSEVQESLSETVIHPELKPDLTFIAVVTSMLLSFGQKDLPHFPSYLHYIPPLIERNIPVFVQSFLL